MIERDICFNMSGVSFCWQYFLINFNFQQRNFVTLKNLILIYMLYIGISYDLILASRQGFGELKTEQLGGHSQEQQRHRQAPIDDDIIRVLLFW